MWESIKKLFRDCLTGIDGKTYDPARVVGYGGAALAIGAFCFALVWHALHGVFDPQAAGIGAGAILGGTAGVGGGVAWKSKTEPQQ